MHSSCSHAVECLPIFPTGLEYYISVRGNVFQRHDQMCLDWLWKATLNLTQPIWADSLSQKIYSVCKISEFLHKRVKAKGTYRVGTQITHYALYGSSL